MGSKVNSWQHSGTMRNTGVVPHEPFEFTVFITIAKGHWWTPLSWALQFLHYSSRPNWLCRPGLTGQSRLTVGSNGVPVLSPWFSLPSHLSPAILSHLTSPWRESAGLIHTGDCWRGTRPPFGQSIVDEVFAVIVGFMGSGADGQKKNSWRRLWCKKVVLLEHGDRTHGQEELLRDHEEILVLYYGVEGQGKV